jgi:hypothetical protein
MYELFDPMDHETAQLYLDAIGDELNQRPRAILGYVTPAKPSSGYSWTTPTRPRCHDRLTPPRHLDTAPDIWPKCVQLDSHVQRLDRQMVFP